jgi:hypothetical protein
MNKKILVPAFVFKPVYRTTNTVTTVIKRRDDVLELEFPSFEKDEVLKTAERLALKKRVAHDRPIDDICGVIGQVGEMWQNPNYHFRQEALEVISMMTGQGMSLCTAELDGNMGMWNSKVAEAYLMKELEGKQVLDNWVKKGTIKIHAQPQGLVYHSLAGNAFAVGMMSLFFALVTKNVNLLKLPREEPYYSVKLAESIAEVDKKVAKELAIMYWDGKKTEIFEALFNSGYVDCVLAWGGLRSIEEIKQRAFRYGIKIIDHGPKFSYSILSDEILNSEFLMSDIARKIGTDVAFWNQRACVSPRVVYIQEKPQKSSIEINESFERKTINQKTKFTSKDIEIDKQNTSLDKDKNNIENNFIDYIKKVDINDTMATLENLAKTINKPNPMDNIGRDFTTIMQRTAKLLRNEISSLSPFGFAKILASEIQIMQNFLPRLEMTDEEIADMEKKREYFNKKFESTKGGTVFTPIGTTRGQSNWTVVYQRSPPSLKEINLCYDRFIIVTRIPSIRDLLHFMRKENQIQFLQTCSIYGSGRRAFSKSWTT